MTKPRYKFTVTRGSNNRRGMKYSANKLAFQNGWPRENKILTGGKTDLKRSEKIRNLIDSGKYELDDFLEKRKLRDKNGNLIVHRNISLSMSVTQAKCIEDSRCNCPAFESKTQKSAAQKKKRQSARLKGRRPQTSKSKSSRSPSSSETSSSQAATSRSTSLPSSSESSKSNSQKSLSSSSAYTVASAREELAERLGNQEEKINRRKLKKFKYYFPPKNNKGKDVNGYNEIFDNEMKEEFARVNFRYQTFIIPYLKKKKILKNPPKDFRLLSNNTMTGASGRAGSRAAAAEILAGMVLSVEKLDFKRKNDPNPNNLVTATRDRFLKSFISLWTESKPNNPKMKEFHINKVRNLIGAAGQDVEIERHAVRIIDNYEVKQLLNHICRPGRTVGDLQLEILYIFTTFFRIRTGNNLYTLQMNHMTITGDQLTYRAWSTKALKGRGTGQSQYKLSMSRKEFPRQFAAIQTYLLLRNRMKTDFVYFFCNLKKDFYTRPLQYPLLNENEIPFEPKIFTFAFLRNWLSPKLVLEAGVKEQEGGFFSSKSLRNHLAQVEASLGQDSWKTNSAAGFGRAGRAQSSQANYSHEQVTLGRKLFSNYPTYTPLIGESNKKSTLRLGDFRSFVNNNSIQQYLNGKDLTRYDNMLVIAKMISTDETDKGIHKFIFFDVDFTGDMFALPVDLAETTKMSPRSARYRFDANSFRSCYKNCPEEEAPTPRKLFRYYIADEKKDFPEDIKKSLNKKYWSGDASKSPKEYKGKKMKPSFQLWQIVKSEENFTPFPRPFNLLNRQIRKERPDNFYQKQNLRDELETGQSSIFENTFTTDSRKRTPKQLQNLD